MSTSLLPAALDALVSLATTSPDLAGLQVLDGPAAAWPEAEFLAVGLSPEDLTVNVTELAGGIASREQSAPILCLIRSWDGSTDVRTRRIRAFQILDVIRTQLELDPSVKGAVERLEVTGSLYAPAQGRRGVVVDIVFVVTARKY